MYTVDPIAQPTVLDLVYPKNEIFVKQVYFAVGLLSADVVCLVPRDKLYTVRPIPYVTTENYVRCLSQTSYLLAEWALRRKLIKTEVSSEDFVAAAANYELYYRNLAMTFHERVDRDREFVLRLRIENARHIRRFGSDYILFNFANERTVISGEMSFAYVK